MYHHHYSFVTILLIISTVDILSAHSNSKHIERFSHPEIEHYKPLLFDAASYNFLVGARDHILQLSLVNFEQNSKRIYKIPYVAEKRKSCLMKGMKKEQCHNFITTLLPIESENYRSTQVLVCGTNAYSPECEIRPLASMDTVTSRSQSINSYSPTWNTTSLVTKNGEFFLYAGPLDLRGIDSSIIRQKIAPSVTRSIKDKRIVRSAQHDSKWINSDANFVHSFEYNQHAYFLFRETAVEYLNCGKRIYSRIGRVCKNDPGMRENWTSFLKTRMNCSLPGLYPFYFDEIQSVDVVETDGSPTLYAIFNTPENSIHGSAVCAFTMDSILDAFDGPFKYQRTSNNLWESAESSKDVFECQSSTNSTQSYDDLRLNSLYQLMNNAAQPVNGKPFMISKQKHFKFIAVDTVNTKHSSAQVMFIATADGMLLKYVKWADVEETCLVDEFQLIEPKEDQFLSMKFFKDTNSLYFGTMKEMIRVQAHRCHIYHTEERCVNSGDPYCGWNRAILKCVSAPGNNYRAENWIQQEVSKCAQQHWGKWFTCKSHDKSSDEEACLCRKRACGGGDRSEHCVDGYEFEVTNCTQHGGWSDWSDWSSCNPSCGIGKQYRTRTCSNPMPLHHGKQCTGLDREERQCEKLPYCNWGPWSEWSNCTEIGSVESKKRTRQCFDSNGNIMDENFCNGNFIEVDICNNDSEWSAWAISEINVNEVVEQRNELSAQVASERRIVPLKYCDTCEGYLYRFKQKQYLIKECNCSEEFMWSEWSEWSECENNTQSRSRACLVEAQYCQGHHIEVQYCGRPITNEPSDFVPTVRASEIYYPHNDNVKIVICIIVTAVLSTLLTGIACLVWLRKQAPKDNLSLMNPAISEPNTYEEPEKYRVTTPLNGNTTLTRTSTLKRDFKNTSFRAKLDDSNY